MASKAKQQAPDAEARQTILQAISAADAPLSAASLSKLPGIGKSARVKSLLSEDVSGGRVFAWGSTYWRTDPETVARERALELASRECISLRDLTKRISQGPPKVSPKIAQMAVKKLIAEKRFLAAESKASGIAGVIDLEHPEAYLERKIAAVLESVGIERSPACIRAFLAAEERAVEQPSKHAPPDVRGVADTMFAAMNRVAFAPGTTVTFYVLRQQPELAQTSKEVFDAAALLLQQERRALLNSHGYAGLVSAQEQEQLVSDGHGNYYVSIYAR